ncbi:MAG: histidinol-phosphatase HisJ [Candidatus Cohnella colombiensis]|uniref:Histidinol-phosphatase n=1 Tax=Candidatus Cohnella colombiensis TaxID=3121368 RepID=A0AA95EZ94_9BACL|nr:MAG: histidinol-phosphatase HisJ [Cohnella sp.]
MRIDYHTHNYRCGHAVGNLEEYVQSAIAKGLREIGLSDHMPLLHVDPVANADSAMAMAELPGYVEECLQLKEKYKDQIAVRVGLEGDFIEGYEDQIAAIVNGYPWDYVIGSVHFLGSWDVTDFRQVNQWEGRSVVSVYEQYFDAIQKAAATGLYDFIGHIDAIKRFGYKPEEDVSALENAALATIANQDLAIELNAAGFYAPVKEMYPSQRMLVQAKALNIPVTFGSDAHHPDKIIQKGDTARELLLQAGYTQLATFEGRKRTLKSF